MISTRYEIAGKKLARAVQILDFVDDVLVHALEMAGYMQRENNGLAVDDFDFEEWGSWDSSHDGSLRMQWITSTTGAAKLMGGELNRVRSTGAYGNRRAFRPPCPAHHNSGVRERGR